MVDLGRNLMHVFVVVVVVFNVAASEKVLILAPSVASHLMQVNSLAEGLIARGHDIYTILNIRAKKGILDPRIKVITYDSGDEPCFGKREYQESLIAPELFDLGFSATMKSLGKAFEFFNTECRGILTNDDLNNKIVAERFDYIVVDGIFKCLYIIPHRLGVPFGVFMAFLPPDIPHAALQSPLLLPTHLDDIISKGKGSRLLTTMGKIFMLAFFSNSLEVFLDIVNITQYELQKKAQLWLYDVSKVLDTPMAVSPNVINVGGLNVRKPKPLPEGELKEFVDSASDGFILVSFGSVAKFIPERIIRILLDAFGEIPPYRIVWKWDKKALKADHVLPPNVLAVNWLPQNDLLGHRNIKLFVTHCGNSGQHEALYNSVPMLGFPLFGDQMFNCRRIDGKFGRCIRANDLSTDKLVDLAKQVIGDRKYSENIAKASAIFRDQPMEPRETAAYWIDHVIKHGADHLLSRTNEMSWIEILMWDVLFVVCVVVFVVLSLVFLLCRCTYRRCCRRKALEAKKKQS